MEKTSNNRKDLEARKPTDLSLTAILGDQTCPPCSLKEFQDYLVYKEHSAENLQFYNWVLSYERRFSRLADEQQNKAPRPPPRRAVATPSLRGRSDSQSSRRTTASSSLSTVVENNSTTELKTTSNDASPDLSFQNSDMAEKERTRGEQPFVAPPIIGNATVTRGRGANQLDTLNEQEPTTAEEVAQFEPEDQPFRAEIDRVISAFFLPGAPAELNVTGAIQKRIRDEAKKTTHPALFEEAKQHVFTTMQKSSFPEFSKLAASNINHEKKVFWLCIGATDFMLGLMVYLLCILLKAGRGWRCFGIPFTWFGCMQFYSATKDLCFQVYGRAARQLYPWELLSDDKSFNLGTADIDFGDTNTIGGINYKSIKQSLLPKSKVFEKEKVIEDPAIKAIQRKRWLETYIVATTVAACVIAACLAVPNRP
ncbi:protein of unknown function [Taphrina deformans PYCC 5710]|uniref:RGS domain-containing protein n=1 Tax=Taphrina deformans (strain PYCC 5710 / ATCC 11124 / CBS 356.35 / IMI 108563 / JCM 9778 / NBRC 8474) TaxID=1097556 RepID=R4XF38_TAPDE|nr:protein of unknown function [Taphrina deformans PYCC 5710]|eukprot:CCG84482.1 protein of unknown function [Taphrina deformans PYCC 5710]